MATLDLDQNDAQYQIRAYQPGVIQVNEMIFNHSLILSASELITTWQPQTVAELSRESLSIIGDMHPDILLLGTGEKHHFIAQSIYGELINLGIGVEVMDTSAACRTFNALSAENRQVVAALIIR